MGRVKITPKTAKKAKTTSKKSPKKANLTKSTSKVIIKKEKTPVPVLTSMVDTPIFEEKTIKTIITYIRRGPQSVEFKPEYAEKILLGMAQGMGIETVCMYLGIPFNVMRTWRRNSKEINALIKYGEKLEKQWWLEQGRKNIYNKDFNHVLWMMNMSNRFDWTTNKREVNGKVAHAHLHKVDGKIAIEKQVEESNDDDRISTVLEILSRSGAFIKKEPVQRITGKTDAETN